MGAEVVVCGLGPAGRALAHRCVVRGMAVTAIDPAPERPWVATYGAWADELPEWLPAGAVAASVTRPAAWAETRHALDRAYAVLDSEGLRSGLDISGARVVAERVVRVERNAVTLASGAVVTGERVIDARGLARSPARAEQTAYGIVLRAADAEALFMDWRADNGANPLAPRSFLYAIPLGDGEFLFEETCLAGRPALGSDELRNRLLHRLSSRGIEFDAHTRVERVRFPVEGGKPGRGRFGAAGGFTHPATGYSVASALSAADAVAAGQSVWPASARAVHALRAAGLRALLALPPADVPQFFEAFFELPAERQRAYLSGRSDLTGTVAAMGGLFRRLPPRLRARIAATTLGIRVGSPATGPSAMME